MSTPAQYVPDEFQQTINLPSGTVNQAALDAANREAARQKAAARAAMVEYSRARDEAARQMARYKRKGASKKDRAEATRIRNRQLQIMKRQTHVRNTALQAQTKSQSKAYELGGDFDKLLTGNERDAFAALRSMFNQFGLGSLSGKIFEYVKQGYGADTITLLLQDTKEYQERFKANAARTKAGLPVLAPAEYLAAESAYRQILSSSGLPKGFYDNPADFQSWIAGDVSPNEIKSRVDMAVAAANKVDPFDRAALFEMYGVDEGGLAAHFLDSKVAEPILRKQFAAGAIGAAALRRGFRTNALDMESYTDLGITGADAEAGYARIADSFETMLGLAGRYGATWTQRDAEREVFAPGADSAVGNENAFEKGKRLRSQERAAFAGGRASSSQGLAAGYRQT